MSQSVPMTGKQRAGLLTVHNHTRQGKVILYPAGGVNPEMLPLFSAGYLTTADHLASWAGPPAKKIVLTESGTRAADLIVEEFNTTPVA